MPSSSKLTEILISVMHPKPGFDHCGGRRYVLTFSSTITGFNYPVFGTLRPRHMKLGVKGRSAAAILIHSFLRCLSP